MVERRWRTGPKPTEFQVKSYDRKHDGFFKVDELVVSFARFRDTDQPEQWSAPVAFEVTQRGDAVAAILYNPGRREVILVNQFRLPVSSVFGRPMMSKAELEKRVGLNDDPGAWILETVAGSLRDPAEKPEDRMKAELQDEAGYRVTELIKIGEYFTSPGGSTERMHLYYAEVADVDKEHGGGGDNASGEDIDLHFIPVDEFFDRLERQEFRDAKIIIGGYWLRDRLARSPQMEKGQTKTELYAVKDRPHRIIGIMTGDIADTHDVDVWVNPENTSMQMDRYFGRSVSAAIRWGGASKRDVGTDMVVDADLIANDLRRKLGNRNYVGLQDVVETTAGKLTGTRNVRAILHVAVAEGHYEQRMRTTVPILEACIDKVLAHIEASNRTTRLIRPYKSVLIPMLGTGTSGLPARDVAPAMVARAMAFHDAHPHSRLTAIYLNAYSINDRAHLSGLLMGEVAKGNLVKK